jgi:hypothetical protein
MNAADIAAIKGKRKSYIKTVSGGTLTAWMREKLYITDENGDVRNHNR